MSTRAATEGRRVAFTRMWKLQGGLDNDACVGACLRATRVLGMRTILEGLARCAANQALRLENLSVTVYVDGVVCSERTFASVSQACAFRVHGSAGRLWRWP